MPDVLLFGATGYTGKLTARVLADRGIDFVVAGRDRAKLEDLAAETGAEVRVATVGDVRGLANALDDVAVMITCVGPFEELGDTAAEAAVLSRTHYIDSTGEGTFVRRLKERFDARAREAGIAMAPALGFDEVPCDVAAALATEGMERADLTLTYALPMNGSRGTVTSSLSIIASRGPWIEEGTVREVGAGESLRWSPMPAPLGPKPAMSFPFAELHLAPLHLDLSCLRTYVTVSPARRAALRVALPGLRLASSTAAGMGLLSAITSRLPEGPSESRRRGMRWMILAEARAGRSWRNVVVSGTDVYGLTAEFLAAGAMKMSEPGYDATGVVAPVQAAGLETWEKEFAAHGVDIDTFERKGV